MERDLIVLKAIDEAAENFPEEFFGEIKRNLEDFFDEEFKRSIKLPSRLWRNKFCS